MFTKIEADNSMDLPTRRNLHQPFTYKGCINVVLGTELYLEARIYRGFHPIPTRATCLYIAYVKLFFSPMSS